MTVNLVCYCLLCVSLLANQSFASEHGNESDKVEVYVSVGASLSMLDGTYVRIDPLIPGMSGSSPTITYSMNDHWGWEHRVELSPDADVVVFYNNVGISIKLQKSYDQAGYWFYDHRSAGHFVNQYQQFAVTEFSINLLAKPISRNIFVGAGVLVSVVEEEVFTIGQEENDPEYQRYFVPFTVSTRETEIGFDIGAGISKRIAGDFQIVADAYYSFNSFDYEQDTNPTDDLEPIRISVDLSGFRASIRLAYCLF